MLRSLTEALAEVARAPLLAVERRLASAAYGTVLAEPVIAPHPVPAHDLALLGGLAVASAAIADASPALPLPPGAARRVRAGEPLPSGPDAVLPDALCDEAGNAIGALAPGENVFRAGQGIGRGVLLLEQGARITAPALLALAEAGIAEVAVRPFRLFVCRDHGAAPAPALLPMLAWPGGALVAERRDAGGIAVEHAAATGVAIASHDGAEVAVLIVPPDPFGALAGTLALGTRLLHRVSLHAAPAPLRLPLAARVTSPPGLATVVLLRADQAVLHPLPWGSLAALAQATHFTVVPAPDEGFPEGALVPAEPLGI
ncbi:MAG: hypothetical protein IT556_18425 [Acetobacteraceae bacterium]|nr:hypothetical protein [Acetobacteraceae bacterium]